MWKIILTGLALLNAQPNDYAKAEKVHVLLVDARSVAVDREGRVIAPHVAALEVPASCLPEGTKGDWHQEFAGGEVAAFFFLNDVGLRFEPSDSADLEIVHGARLLENGAPRALPCCVESIEKCDDDILPEFRCDEGAHPFSEQRRDLTWVTPMKDLGGNGKLRRDCEPPNVSACPQTAWFTIEGGRLETHLLEGEDPADPKIEDVRKTYVDGTGSARAAAREILWTLPGEELRVTLAPQAGGEPRVIALQKNCPNPTIRLHNAPIESLLRQHGHDQDSLLSKRHAEHLFRLLADAGNRGALEDPGGSTPYGTGICPPGSSGGP